MGRRWMWERRGSDGIRSQLYLISSERVREDGDAGGDDTEEVVRKARHYLC
jgi:hypothetical protein